MTTYLFHPPPTHLEALTKEDGCPKLPYNLRHTYIPKHTFAFHLACWPAIHCYGWPSGACHTTASSFAPTGGSCHNTWDKIQQIATFQYFPTKWFLFFCPWVTRHTRQVEPERFDKKRPLLQFAKRVGVTVAISVTILWLPAGHIPRSRPQTNVAASFFLPGRALCISFVLHHILLWEKR